MEGDPVSPHGYPAVFFSEDSDAGTGARAVFVRRSGTGWRRLAVGSSAAGLLLLAGAAVLLLRQRAGTALPGRQQIALGSTVQLQEEDCTKSGASQAWCEKGEVSLYCFSQIVAYGTEEDLIKLQLKQGLSIFACDDFTVTCADDRLLGTDTEGNEVRTVINPEKGQARMGDTNAGATTASFLNVLIFMKAWDIILNEGKVWIHDWTVKVDPDAVFFPPRLRTQLQDKTGPEHPSSYLLNCREKHWKQDNVQGDGHFYFVPKLYGALEVYNMKALGAYKDVHQRCLEQLRWHKWGEDMYMRMCMNLIGIQKVVDYELVGDERCPGNPPSQCGDADRPAYHPHKEIRDWFTCYNQSMGIKVEEQTSEGPIVDVGEVPADASHAKPYGGCGGKGKDKKKCPSGFLCHKASRWYWQCLPKEDGQEDVEHF